MAQTTKEVSNNIALAIEISVLRIWSIILHDGYNVHFEQDHKEKRRGANRALCFSTEYICLIKVLSNGILDAIFHLNLCTIPMTISEHIKAISEANPNYNSKYICQSNSDCSHCQTLLLEGGLLQRLWEAVSKHLSSWYVAQLDLSISSHICCKKALYHKVCNCGSMDHSVPDPCHQ